MMDPDGIIFLLIFFLAGFLILLFAFLIEAMLAAEMRQRRRHWRMMSRYVDSISNGDDNDRK